MSEGKEEDLTWRYGPYIAPVSGMMEQQPVILNHPQSHLLMQQQYYSQPGYVHQALMGMQPPMAYASMQTPVSDRSVASVGQQLGTYEQVMQQQMTSQQQQHLQQALLQQQMLAMQQKQQQQQTSQVQPSAELLAQLQRQQMQQQQPGYIYRQQQPY